MKKNYAIYKLLTFTFIFSVGAVMAQSSNQVGEWSEPIQFGLVPVAVANLPDGRLLTWSSRFRDAGFDAADGNTYTEIYDPFQGPNGTALGTQITPNNHNMFCPGINNLANGDILVAGGGSAPKTTIYNVATNSWEVSDDMNVPRGYQGNVTLPDGRAFTIGGQWNGGYSGKVGEIWTKGQGWVSLPGLPGTILYNDNDLQGNPIRPNDHAWVWVAPNGKIFHAGPSEEMHWFDVRGNGSSTFAGKRADDTFSITGTTIMYDIGKILKVGGALNYQQGFPSKDNSFVIDINNENNVTVSPTANNLQLSRSYHNSVVLPNGEVVVTGGISTSSVFTDTGARFEAEIWNPQTNSWRTVAGMQIPRTYHSVSILMTDGRVFVGGGGLIFGGGGLNHLDAEIYSPPYLFDGNGNLAQRPTLSAPATAGFDQQLTVTGSDDIGAFSFIRMSSATHSTNNEQRRVPVSYTKNGNQYTVNVPNANIMPPGNYMLFALNSNGVPSMAETVLVGNGNATTTPPTVSGTNLAPEAGIAVSSEFSAQFSKDKLVDGITGQPGNGEWASLGEQNPTITLNWDRPVIASQIVLYDRPIPTESIVSGRLVFSDGSVVAVGDLPTDGSAFLVNFSERTFTSVRLEVTNSVGPNVGLAEFQVFGQYTATPPLAVSGNNVAPEASSITASSEFSAQFSKENIIDGIKGLYGAGEWASLGEQTPTITLNWDRPVRTSQIVLYNRSSPFDRIRSSRLVFSDGSIVEVGDLPTDGSAFLVNFSERTITSVRFEVIDGIGPNVGLAEFQVFGEFGAAPPTVTGTNLAPEASSITVSSEFSAQFSKDKLVDGITGQFGNGEWASLEEQTPTVTLNWERPVIGSQIVLFDRTLFNENILSGRLIFSDGSVVNVGNLPTDGSAFLVSFSERTFTSVRFEVTNGVGPNVGLAEFQVFGEFGVAPPAVTGTNLAPQASSITVSSEFSAQYSKDKLVDGITGQFGNGEWASLGEQNPTITLNWDRPVIAKEIVLYDRPIPTESIESGRLVFSDGSVVNVGNLPTDGSAFLVSFSERTFTSVRFEVTNSIGPNVGLAEFQVFGEFGVAPPAVTGTNLAPEASSITVSSEFSAQFSKDKLVDGITGQFGNGEWASLEEQTPTVTLNWERPVIGSQIVLFDRTLFNENILSGRLVFSDGSVVNVGNLPTDGSAFLVSFSERTFTSVRFEVTNGVGPNVGLAEFQVFGEFGAAPPTVTGTNLAPEASSITVSSEFSARYAKSKLVDGITGFVDPGEWASFREQNPSIRLTWDRPVTTSQVVLYDRPNVVDVIFQGVLKFSDGSTVTVNGLENSGTANIIDFQQKTITWVEFDITNGQGYSVGLAEFEVYGKFSGSQFATTPTTNIAPQASNITASSEFSVRFAKRSIVDGIIGLVDPGEWASLGEQRPSVTLTWNQPIRTDRIVLFDRPLINENINAGRLVFSDGSVVQVGNLPANGGALPVVFSERTITSIRFEVTDGIGPNVGLSEFQVFGEFTQLSESNSSRTNLALNKPTAQSSSSRIYIGPSSRAVDGNTNGNFNVSNGSVTHTNTDARSWWLVDLGRAYTISDINVYNRTDCCSDRLQGARLYIGNVFSNNPADYTEVSELSGATSVQNVDGISTRGRYVMIRHTRTAILSLAEVEVFGSLPPGSASLQVSSFNEEIQEEMDVLVYPNPTPGELNLNLGNKDKGENVSILIFGNDGRTVLQKDYGLDYGIIETLNLDFIANGVYYVQITKGDTTLTKTIIVSK